MKKIQKSGALLSGLVALTLVSAESANAALSTAIGTTLTGIQTDGLALVDLIWPVVGAVVGAFIMFKLFKRGASKI